MLNLLISQFQQSNDDATFTQIYHLALPNVERLVRKLSSKYRLDDHITSSLVHNKLYEMVIDYDKTKGNFRNLLSRAIRNGCIDEVRKELRRQRKETSLDSFTADDGEDNETSMLDLIATANAEDEIIEGIQKNNDQQQLIARLMKNSNDATRQSINAFIESGSFRSAAKLLGKKDKKSVIRPIRNLSRQFNANQMGDYRDYFTVATVKVV